MTNLPFRGVYPHAGGGNLLTQFSEKSGRTFGQGDNPAETQTAMTPTSVEHLVAAGIVPRGKDTQTAMTPTGVEHSQRENRGFGSGIPMGFVLVLVSSAV
jgi:hypothetical protein